MKLDANQDNLVGVRRHELIIWIAHLQAKSLIDVGDDEVDGT